MQKNGAIKKRVKTMKNSGSPKVCVVGLGYIGLPTSIIAAEHGLNVIGFDIDHRRVERINNYDPVIQEPEIAEKLLSVLDKGTFQASTTIVPADYFIIAVPTPFTDDKKADLSYVFSAADHVAAVLKKGDTVILESTVPVKTTEKLAQYLETKTLLKAGEDFFVAHCPERVLPGNIFKELVHNARIIGGINPRSVAHAKELYKHFVQGSLYLTDANTAEMVKLVENSSRDVAIAFANQVASMAYAIGLNPNEVIELANKHPRVNILRPGCGVGGHCIAVDPWFLVETFPQQTGLLKMAREVNDAKPYEVLAQIKKEVIAFNRTHTQPCRVLALGLTYKADVDDLRESPALFIAEQLSSWQDISLTVCEPNVTVDVLEKVGFEERLVQFAPGIEQADIIVTLVAHSAFKTLRMYAKNKKVIDISGLLHVPRQESTEQERYFWPASSVYEWDEDLQLIPLRQIEQESQA
jgi:UDP-N-acetyl-D-mannosaminuronic acid dehydrogenase